MEKSGAPSKKAGKRAGAASALSTRRPVGKKLSTRAHRAMKKREPQLVEGDKRLLALKGPTSSEIVREAMVDLVRSRVYIDRVPRARVCGKTGPCVVRWRAGGAGGAPGRRAGACARRAGISGKEH